LTRVRLRPTMLSDLDSVVSVEQDGANRPFITPWERTQHEGAIRFPDSRHFVVEAGDAWQRAFKLYASEGFVEEGRLRESVRISGPNTDGHGDGCDSLVVMSMLDREHAP
jgi:diamine N-acetyltransferase